MSSRTDLQTYLETLIGSENVYFQPPPSIQMSYPCIVYRRSRIETEHANNKPYSHRKRYTITVIDKDPDSLLPDLVSDIPTASFDAHYAVDNLNHDVFTIYF